MSHGPPSCIIYIYYLYFIIPQTRVTSIDAWCVSETLTDYFYVPHTRGEISEHLGGNVNDKTDV